MILFTKTR